MVICLRIMDTYARRMLLASKNPIQPLEVNFNHDASPNIFDNSSCSSSDISVSDDDPPYEPPLERNTNFQIPTDDDEDDTSVIATIISTEDNFDLADIGNRNYTQQDEEDELPNITRRRPKRKKQLIPRFERRRIIRVQKHTLRAGCGENCKKQCMHRFSTSMRQQINAQYWQMSWKEQRIFITSTVKRKTPKSHKHTNSIRQRKNVFTFNLANQSVCRTFYLTTLGYKKTNEKIIRNTFSNVSDNSLINSSFNDQRGSTRKKFSSTEFVCKHIESFSPAVSHYRREHAPKRLYLPCDLNIRLMFNDYMDSDSGKENPCSYRYYALTIKNMNISFTKLGNEECEVCAEHDQHVAVGCSEIGNVSQCNECLMWTEHMEHVKICRSEYKKDSNVICDAAKETIVSADMQKVFMLPNLPSFKRCIFTKRIIAFNESFVPLGEKFINRGYAVLWHEATGGRKARDITSAFHRFILENKTKQKITIWLDNCSSQNKNWTLFSFLISIVNSNKITAEQITLKYLEPGHTFMSADSLHAAIEKQRKIKEKIYDFQDWVDVVSTAGGEKICVLEITHLDFSQWEDNHSEYQVKKLNPRPLLADMHCIQFTRGSYTLHFKNKFTENNFKEVDFLYVKVLADAVPFINIPIKEPRGIPFEVRGFGKVYL